MVLLPDPDNCHQCILEISNAILTKHTREELFQCLSLEIGKLIRYDRFSINLFDETTNTLSYFAVADGIRPSEITCENRRPLKAASIANWVINTRQPLIMRDMSEFSHFPTVQAMRGSGLKSTMAFPLIMREKILGTIHFSFREVPDRLEALKDMIEALSLQVTIAVDNMLSYEKLSEINRKLEQERTFLRDGFERGWGQFLYSSSRLAEIMEGMDLIAGSEANVLITGETGTGKDHLARYIHTLSPRRRRLFVKVNCAALSPTLVESELFGHAKGAFTGASSRRAGRFEMADGGTVFLDEVGDLPLSAQAKLLQVLQERTFERVGESASVSVDIRILSASNAELKDRIQRNEFRRDLFYRLNTIHIHIPPLRERPEDISILVEHFSRRHAERMRKSEPRFTEGAIRVLREYPWPGNVREVENLTERIVIMMAGREITDSTVYHMLDPSGAPEPEVFLPIRQMEKSHIERALSLSAGVTGGRKGAAGLLGIPRSTLQYRIRKLGIDTSEFLRPIKKG